MAFEFFKSLINRFSDKPVDWDELEETLIRSDIGVPMTLRIVEDLQQRQTKITAKDVVDVTRSHIEQILPIANPRLRPLPSKPKVILMVGVNGTGKTTSTAKLAYLLKQDRHTVMLAAADTFRAAAIEQLKIWADRLQVDVITGEYGADPAALCYDAYSAANKRNIEFLICDTAGRLHTKHNLMQELGKVVRTLQKHDEQSPHECLLVVDATTGSNAVVQAKEFKQAVGLTGLVVTKLDGSGKGGIVIAIQDELAIPPRFVGTGEKPGDLQYFDKDEFISKLL
ncbi:MAG: signal recognition particle-docking protein FtsY [Verrucomicrobia bacterium]|nr:signal recognition particle-docking protein FtsY [Verrucomicrobiota bacterium]MBV8642019.1 signal recognition particle-docking protein FtsY [Verrucomicrobiota bacterium]